MSDRAARDGRPLNFIGAGAYEHHIPAPVWAITTRGEFYSAYTPYQAEASQGTLQLIYEYQSMMCALTGMEVSNASLYDGASAAGRSLSDGGSRQPRRELAAILLPRAVNPTYAQVAQAIAGNQDIVFERVDFDRADGAHPARERCSPTAARTSPPWSIQQPNFFGCLEEVDALTDWAHANKILVIAVVNPTSLALLKPPGQWGSADRRPPAAPTSSAAKGSRWACRWPRADRTSDSWRPACSMCDRCPAASSGAPWTWTGVRDSA